MADIRRLLKEYLAEVLTNPQRYAVNIKHPSAVRVSTRGFIKFLEERGYTVGNGNAHSIDPDDLAGNMKLMKQALRELQARGLIRDFQCKDYPLTCNVLLAQGVGRQEIQAAINAMHLKWRPPALSQYVSATTTKQTNTLKLTQ